jgi:TetR/AcrR family transcriptional regulator, transcriptional repressor for nem operon
MQAFWKNGYESTSISDLEAVTGLSRVSIYNTFGDKEGLFLATLDHYHRMVQTRLNAILGDDGLAGIERFFRGMTLPRAPETPFNHGCMMVNAVLDAREGSPQAVARIRAYRGMFKDAFAAALDRAATSGEITLTPSAREPHAEYLVGLLWGLLVTVRLADSTLAGAPIVEVLASTLASWRASAAQT